MAATWGTTRDIPFLSSPRVRICTVTGKSGLLRMQNFPFIFKILYPNVAGRKLIYSEGAAKETASRVLPRISEGLSAAKLTGACQKLRLIIKIVAIVVINERYNKSTHYSWTRYEYLVNLPWSYLISKTNHFKFNLKPIS